MSIDMHDYTRQAKVYWWLTASLGALVLAGAVWSALHNAPLVIFEIVFGAALAAVTGLFAARIPGTKISSGAAEVVTFLLRLALGSEAAAIAAAAEAGAISSRTSKRWTSRIGSPAMAGLAMYACASLFELACERAPAMFAPGVPFEYVLLLAFAVLYFAVNTLLMATLIRLKRGEAVRPFATLKEHSWLAVVYMASASITLLLRTVFSGFGASSLLVAAPVIAVFVLVLHVYTKRAEERERFQAERIESAERAAAEAAQHLRELQESEERFQSAFTHAAVGMALTTADRRILQVNPSLARLLGREEGNVVGTALDDLFHESALETLHAEIRALLTEQETAFVTELRCRHASGVEIVAAVCGSLFAVRAPLSRCVILQFQDVTARARAESRLHHIANHDSLTDLANRNCFMDQLRKAVESAAKHPERRFAVLFLDFDRFKLVNDSLGHGAGDALLKGVARRLQSQLRPTDLVARFGGDEFAILLQDAKADQEATRLAQRIQDAIVQPMHLDGVAITTSVSIGITTSAFGYESPEQVIRDADIAMYRAKAQGRARFAVFDSALHSEVADRLWLEAELRHAIKHDELTLAYQPIYDCSTRTVIGFEALARWNQSQRGPIAPDTFIRIAEETGLIVPLGAWALREACRTAAAWRALSPANDGLSIHVNVSGAQLAQADFPAMVRSALRETGIDPRQLVIEITESILIERRSVAIPHLHELRELGLSISIDDFGTGYSSFSVLHELPVDEIKIDRTFIAQLGATERGDAVVATMLALGRTLGKAMVAEGIETEGQLVRLVEMGCSKGQGYLLSRPLTLDAADALVQARLARESRDAVEVPKLRPRAVAGAESHGRRSAVGARDSDTGDDPKIRRVG